MFTLTELLHFALGLVQGLLLYPALMQAGLLAVLLSDQRGWAPLSGRERLAVRLTRVAVIAACWWVGTLLDWPAWPLGFLAGSLAYWFLDPLRAAIRPFLLRQFADAGRRLDFQPFDRCRICGRRMETVQQEPFSGASRDSFVTVAGLLTYVCEEDGVRGTALPDLLASLTQELRLSRDLLTAVATEGAVPHCVLCFAELRPEHQRRGALETTMDLHEHGLLEVEVTTTLLRCPACGCEQLPGPEALPQQVIPALEAGFVLLRRDLGDPVE